MTNKKLKIEVFYKCSKHDKFIETHSFNIYIPLTERDIIIGYKIIETKNPFIR